MQPQPCARSPGRTSFLLGFQHLCLWQFSSRGNAKEAMGTCVTCISVFGAHKSCTSLGLIWHLPVEQEFFSGCSGIEALHLNRFQILYLLFVLRKRKFFAEICIQLKRGVPPFFSGSYCFINHAVPSLCTEHWVPAPIPVWKWKEPLCVRALKCLSMSQREGEILFLNECFLPLCVLWEKGEGQELPTGLASGETHVPHCSTRCFYMYYLEGVNWCGRGRGGNAKPQLKQFHASKIVLSNGKCC